MNVLNTKKTILKKINVSFIVYFCFGKFSLSLDTFKHTSYIGWLVDCLAFMAYQPL